MSHISHTKSAAAKYVSDDEDGDPKESSRHSSHHSNHARGDKGNGSGVGGPGPVRPYVADVSGSEPKGYLFSVNKNPINVERCSTCF